MAVDATGRRDLGSLTGAVVGGDYEIERPLGRGGMGTVYVARQLSTGKQRALKLMRPELLLAAGSQERFAEEARHAARVDSEHVVQIVAAGFDPALEVPWIAMELLSGESLAEHLARVGPLAPREAIEIFRDVCRGLAAAHRAGLVHRDLKPENVFLARHPDDPERRTAKLLDFGIAKLLHATSAATTSAMGSPAWVAPEQANGEPVSPATDIWALGLLAFQLLVGGSFWRAAHGDGTLQSLLTEILIKPIPAPSERARELGRALPPGFDAWFSRAVAREPAARYCDPLTALAALEGALGTVATGSLRPLGEAQTASGRVVVRASDEPQSRGPLSLGSAPTAAALQVAARAPARAGRGRAWAWGLLIPLLAVGLGGVGWFAFVRGQARGGRRGGVGERAAEPAGHGAAERRAPARGLRPWPAESFGSAGGGAIASSRDGVFGTVSAARALGERTGPGHVGQRGWPSTRAAVRRRAPREGAGVPGGREAGAGLGGRAAPSGRAGGGRADLRQAVSSGSPMHRPGGVRAPVRGVRPCRRFVLRSGWLGGDAHADAADELAAAADWYERGRGPRRGVAWAWVQEPDGDDREGA